VQEQGLWAPDASTPIISLAQQWLLGLAASTGCPTALKRKGCQSCPAHWYFWSEWVTQAESRNNSSPLKGPAREQTQPGEKL